MDALTAIMTRRSIRKYKEKRVPLEMALTLLRAGMAAPSARNKQPWEFLVIQKRETLNEIAQWHPYAKMLREAFVAILVCANKNIQEIEGYCALDCAAATENILLAAHALGLGGVWIGIYPRAERIAKVKDMFSLPPHILPISLVSIGYPAEEKSPANRFDISKVHFDKW
jgi:nitroreductase